MGEVAFNSIWIFRDTIAFSVLYVLGLFLTFPIIIMLTLDFGSNWHKTIGVDNNDQLIERLTPIGRWHVAEKEK